MTSRSDPGRWIALAGAGAVIAAVIAGLATIGGPGEARAVRLDGQRLAELRDIATAAQCAYTFTGKTPETLDAIALAIAARTDPVPECGGVQLTPADHPDVTYAAKGAQDIELCATFERPSPRHDRATNWPGMRGETFPELAVPRAAAGPHCFTVRIVRLKTER